MDNGYTQVNSKIGNGSANRPKFISYSISESLSKRTVIEEMPFAIQRIQTDRGKEFFAYKVQELLIEWAIKFRPVKPASPHLNGKVERSQQTDLQEFYSVVDIKARDLEDQLQQWQHDYN